MKLWGCLLECSEGVIEVLREHIAFHHGLLDGATASHFGSLDRGIVLTGGLFQIAAPDIGGNFIDRDAGIHGAGLNCPNHALHHQGHNVAAIGVVEGRIAHGFEKWQEPVQLPGASIEQRLDLVMKVRVPHLPHMDDSIDGRRDHHVIGSINTGIGLRRVQQGLDHHQKAPADRGAGSRLEIDAGIADHLGQGIVQLG